MVDKVLVIGNSVRNIVCSARMAEYTVYALDRFGDVDLQKCAHKSQIIGNNEKELVDIVGSFGEVDAIILGPGFENLNVGKTLNNPARIIKDASDKSKLPERFASLGIPHPKTEQADKAEGMEFPLMVKPKSGSGGMMNIIVRNESEMNDFKDKNESGDFIAQEFIEGISCSASLICTGDDSSVISLNEQLIGLPWLTRLPFAYCGNITPFHTKFKEEMIRYARQIAAEFMLKGSNGIDFIVNDKGVYVIEINPRFQGSLDTVELSTGINIFDAHIKSFDGVLPQRRDFRCFASKAIVFAEEEVVINENISDTLLEYMNKGEAVDIPVQGTVIRPDEPITTLLGNARTRAAVLDIVKKSSHRIKKIMGPSRKDINILNLKKSLNKALKIDEKKRAQNIKEIGFRCKKCAQCCSAQYGDNTVIVFPSEIRLISEKTGLQRDDFAMPAPSTDRDVKGNIHTFEWMLKKNRDCFFLENGMCKIYECRPHICRTYPFYLLDGELEVSDCDGIGEKINSKESLQLAQRIKKRYIMEIEEMISLLEKFNGFIPGGHGNLCVHDSEGEHWI